MTDLSPRQHAVLTLVADGLTDQEIAGRLYCGVATIRRHNADLRDKLGARNRAHAVGIAYRTGVLTPDAKSGAKPGAKYDAREDA